MLWPAWLGLLVVSTRLKETLGQTRSVPELAALGIHFADEDLQKGVIAGSLYIRRPQATATNAITSFNVYWGSDATTKLNSEPLVSVALSAISPTCSGTSCSEIAINPVEGSSSSYLISRGRTGYNNDESATILLPSDGTATVLYCATEWTYDVLTVGSEYFSGWNPNMPTPPISVTAGTTISWTSDSSVTANYGGWEVTFQSDVAEMLQANISTTIPEGASHFLVYSSNSFGEMTSPVSSPISDMYVLPAPSSLTFTDGDSTANHMSGLLQLSAPSDVNDVLRYDVYWGVGNTRMGVCSATVGYRFEPGPNLTRDCSGADFLRLLPLPAQSVSGPVQLGGYALRFDGTFIAQTALPFFFFPCSPCSGVGWTVAAWVNPAVEPFWATIVAKYDQLNWEA